LRFRVLSYEEGMLFHAFKPEFTTGFESAVDFLNLVVGQKKGKACEG
jgi:hypothetical protein